MYVCMYVCMNTSLLTLLSTKPLDGMHKRAMQVRRPPEPRYFRPDILPNPSLSFLSPNGIGHHHFLIILKPASFGTATSTITVLIFFIMINLAHL